MREILCRVWGGEVTGLDLPSLVHCFRHAQIRGVSRGPRREVTLDIALLVWERSQGKWVGGVRVRLGGRETLEEVEGFFATALEDKSGLADLRHAEAPKSKLGKLHVELICEYVDARLVVRCSSLQVTGPEVGNLPRG